MSSSKDFLMNFSKEDLVNLFLVQVRNIWSVDGLYFLGIEDKWGTKEATSIDRQVWKVMAKIEAKRIRKALNLNCEGVPCVAEALKTTSWYLSLEEKEFEVAGDQAILKVSKCRTQLKRIEKGRTEFPCKTVRWSFLSNFAAEIDPNVKVTCEICPPDKHPENLWCKWRFHV